MEMLRILQKHLHHFSNVQKVRPTLFAPITVGPVSYHLLTVEKSTFGRAMPFSDALLTVPVRSYRVGGFGLGEQFYNSG